MDGSDVKAVPLPGIPRDIPQVHSLERNLIMQVMGLDWSTSWATGRQGASSELPFVQEMRIKTMKPFFESVNRALEKVSHVCFHPVRESVQRRYNKLVRDGLINEENERKRRREYDQREIKDEKTAILETIKSGDEDAQEQSRKKVRPNSKKENAEIELHDETVVLTEMGRRDIQSDDFEDTEAVRIVHKETLPTLFANCESESEIAMMRRRLKYARIRCAVIRCKVPKYLQDGQLSSESVIVEQQRDLLEREKAQLTHELELKRLELEERKVAVMEATAKQNSGV